MRRRLATMALAALFVAPAGVTAQAPTGFPSVPPDASPLPSATPEPIIVLGYQLVTNAEPPFALLIPEDWTVDTEPNKGTVWSARAPEGVDGIVSVAYRTSGAASKSNKAWMDARKKAIKKDADIGGKVLYSGVVDFLPAGPAANVESANAYLLASHTDEYRYPAGEGVGVVLTLQWFHAGWDPKWFTIRDSFNPVAAVLPDTFDTSNVVPPSLWDNASSECIEATRGLYDALFDLDSRLDVGLLLADYRTKVGDAQVAYNRINSEELQQSCRLLVREPLQRALNEYIAAQNRWSQCVTNFRCSMSKIRDNLQTRWAAASAIVRDLSRTQFVP